MSNIVPISSQVPAHLANRVGASSALASSLAGGLATGADYPRISIKGSRFRIVDSGTETVLNDPTLAVVIVGANPNLSKAFYAAAWNPDAEATAPDCFSLDGVRPDPASSQPQNDLCASCPQNAWGSKKTAQGADIKACADKKRLAIVAADDPEGPIYLLEVTPAALKGLNQYQRELAMHGVVPEIAKTIVSFDTKASFPKIQFGFGGFLTEETQGAVDKLFGTPKVLEITGESGGAPTPATANTVIVKATGMVTQAAKPEPEPEPEPEAAPTASFGKPAASSFGKPAAKAKVPEEEPKAAAATTDASTAGLASEIAALMKEVNTDD